MNILDAARDLEQAATDVLEATKRRNAAIEHATACLKVASSLRDQLPPAERKWFDTHMHNIGVMLGLRT